MFPGLPIHDHRQLLRRPTRLALVKGEAWHACSRQLGDQVPPGQLELVGGVEAMAGLVARITEEQMVAQQLLLPPGVIPPPLYPMPERPPGEEEGGVPEEAATLGEAAEDQEAGKKDSAAAAAERGLEKLKGKTGD